ncbi:NAD(P)-binding protein [Backusella circina FSU 941]|nr:NAD(P)-binding protein [Backusella circina FSU 941]
MSNKLATVGKPGELVYKEEPIPSAKDDTIVIKNHYIGINLVDIHQLQRIINLTGSDILGLENAGEVIQVGKDVTKFKVGDRVISTVGMSYANFTELPNSLLHHVTKLPDDISYETAIGVGLQGVTAYPIATKEYSVKKGDFVLVHAAAGGVGIMLVQLLTNLGANVIGTVSTEEKAQIAKKFGATHTINYTNEDIAKRVMEITRGEGVPLALDGVGKSTFNASLNSLRRKGIVVYYGSASGYPQTELTTMMLAKNLKIHGGAIYNYEEEGDGTDEWWHKLFDMVRSGSLKTYVSKTYTFDQVQEAFDEMDGRKTVGKCLIKL